MDNKKPHASIAASGAVTEISMANSFMEQMEMGSEYKAVFIGKESYTFYLIFWEGQKNHKPDHLIYRTRINIAI